MAFKLSEVQKSYRHPIPKQTIKDTIDADFGAPIEETGKGDLFCNFASIFFSQLCMLTYILMAKIVPTCCVAKFPAALLVLLWH